MTMTVEMKFQRRVKDLEQARRYMRFYTKRTIVKKTRVDYIPRTWRDLFKKYLPYEVTVWYEPPIPPEKLDG